MEEARKAFGGDEEKATEFGMMLKNYCDGEMSPGFYLEYLEDSFGEAGARRLVPTVARLVLEAEVRVALLEEAGGGGGADGASFSATATTPAQQDDIPWAPVASASDAPPWAQPELATTAPASATARADPAAAKPEADELAAAEPAADKQATDYPEAEVPDATSEASDWEPAAGGAPDAAVHVCVIGTASAVADFEATEGYMARYGRQLFFKGKLFASTKLLRAS